MKKGERFRIAVEAGVVLLLAVGVFRVYQVRQDKAKSAQEVEMHDDRGVARILKKRVDEKQPRERSMEKGLDAEDRGKLSDLGTEDLSLPEPALLVIQVVDSQGSPVLEPITVFSREGRFTNRVVDGRLALSLSAMSLEVGAVWDAEPSLAIAPVRVDLKAGESSAAVLVLDPGVLPGFDLVRQEGLLLVSRVDPGSPAAQAGLRIDDIIVGVAGIEAEQLSDAVLVEVLESPLQEPLPITVAEQAGDRWQAVNIVVQP